MPGESSETEKEVDPFYIFEVLNNIGQSTAKTNFFVLSNPKAHGVRTQQIRVQSHLLPAIKSSPNPTAKPETKIKT